MFANQLIESKKEVQVRGYVFRRMLPEILKETVLQGLLLVFYLPLRATSADQLLAQVEAGALSLASSVAKSRIWKKIRFYTDSVEVVPYLVVRDL